MRMLAALLYPVAVACTMAQGPLVREPTLPDAWLQTFEVQCGSETLRVSGYGARLPAGDAGAAVLSNGREVGGTDSEALRRDLSNRRAAYRLTGQCLPDGEGIWFRIYSGEKIYPGNRPPGRMRYLAGSATIRNGRIERYNGLQPVTEEAYWFR